MTKKRPVKTIADVKALLESGDCQFLKVGVFDTDGIFRGKYMSHDKFLSALESGFSFCDVVLGWDLNDQLYDSATFTGWHTGYPDAEVHVLPESARFLPFEDKTLLFLAEFSGAAESICPRGLLRRVLAYGRDRLELSVKAGFEFEFFMFDETPESVRSKGYRNLKTWTPGYFGYSMLRNSVHAEFYHELIETFAGMDVPLEGLHTETGPGVLEAAIEATDGLEAADRAALFKTFAKVLAERRGLMATFMARWSENWPGQSGHIHISLADAAGDPVFYRSGADHGMSDTMRWFLGGQQQLMPEILAMVASTVNSYTRLVPGFWAPTHATWGLENRTCALRAITGSAKSQRVEYRVAAADINPYIALAAALGSGFWGIANRIEPTAPVTGNAYAQQHPEHLRFPATLGAAAKRLRDSTMAAAMFGEAFVEHFVQSRQWEERQFQKNVTDWELARYFEII